jgi:RND superfamily putative drug exporter
MMSRLVRLAVRWPKQVIAVWLVFVAVFTVIGLNVTDKLLPSNLNVPGTGQYHAFQLSKGHFPEQEAAVLLKGPPAALDAQGPALTRALALRPYTRAVSPWSAGAGDSAKTLRPKPGEALIAVALDIPKGENASTIIPPFKRFVAQRLSPPIQYYLSGTAVIQEDLNRTLVHSIEHAELLALPILVIVLLLVFRSPLAAAIPLIMGQGTVYAGYGVLKVIAEHQNVDAVAFNMVSMVGLALGVDYSLLIVNRYREALKEGMAPRQAATLAGNTAGRTANFAGFTLLGIMIVVIFLSPGTVMLSGSLGAVIVTILSMAGAAIVTPAWVRLLGHRVNAFNWGPAAAPEGTGRISRIVDTLARRPALVAAAVLGIIGLMAAPALALQTIPPDPRTLPKDDKALHDFYTFRTAGFGPAIMVILDTPNGSITDLKRLNQIQDFQQRLSRLQYAKSVLGPGTLQPTAKQFNDTPKGLAKLQKQLKEGKVALAQLQSGLGRAANGVGQLRNGLSRAANGASRLEAGSGQALAGSQQLQSGTARARAGARQLAAGSSRLSRGINGRLVPGAERLARGLRGGQGRLHALRVPAQVTTRELNSAQQALAGMTVGKSDPLYAGALRAVTIALAASTPLDPALATAADQAGQGANGADQIALGSRQAGNGAQRISAGATQLSDGLGLLLAGQGQLTNGLGQIRNGSGLLANGLAAGFVQSAPLQSGLAGAATKVGDFRKKLLGPGATKPLDQLHRLQTQSPGFFHSGYLTVAALQGAPPFANATSAFLVDAAHGGNVARVSLLPSVPPNDPRTASIVDNTVKEASGFQKQTGMNVGVGGSATQLVDYKRIVQGRLPLLIIAIAIVTYLFLVPVLRSLLLPAIAVGLNLLTVAAAFGILTLLYTGSHPILGASGALDVVAVGGIFSITFALSIDYQVFLLTRMREEFVRTQSNADAIKFGIDKTAKVVTAAAAIMIAVFSAFALSSFVGVSEFGIGLTTAVFIDATIVRLALLPNVMRIGGLWTWWLPNWLDERLPLLDIEGSEFEHEQAGLHPRAVSA